MREQYQHSFNKLDLKSLSKIHDTSVANQNDVYTGRTAILVYNDWYILSIFAYTSEYIHNENEDEEVTYSIKNYTSTLYFIQKNKNFFKNLSKTKINFF